MAKLVWGHIFITNISIFIFRYILFIWLMITTSDYGEGVDVENWGFRCISLDFFKLNIYFLLIWLTSFIVLFALLSYFHENCYSEWNGGESRKGECYSCNSRTEMFEAHKPWNIEKLYIVKKSNIKEHIGEVLKQNECKIYIKNILEKILNKMNLNKYFCLI